MIFTSLTSSYLTSSLDSVEPPEDCFPKIGPASGMTLISRLGSKSL